MVADNFLKGVIFWVDDQFESQPLPDRHVWGRLFGSHSDRLYRLMDLRLEVASSYKEAMERLEKYQATDESGTFVHCLVDLSIPAETGAVPQIKFGVQVAKEIKALGLHFAFLSANSNASQKLEQQSLASVPYYVKERAGDHWQLPDSLIMMLLSEIRSHISWGFLDDAIQLLHSDSQFVPRGRARTSDAGGIPPAFHYFPFFGPYRDYVERCVYGGPLDPGRSYSVRSNRLHCDEFVKQCLLVALNQTLRRSTDRVKLSYGWADDGDYIQQIFMVGMPGLVQCVDVIRVNPDATSVDQLKDLLHETGAKPSMTIFVIPNDESADRYADIFHEFRVVGIDELPQNRPEDVADREELVRRCAALAFQQWIQMAGGNMGAHFSRLYLAHPELLINPVNWIVLLEPTRVAEELSDPYELTNEFIEALLTSAPKLVESGLGNSKMLPIAYVDLLRVGHKTFEKSEFKKDLPHWMEMAIDNWLVSSWGFPHSLRKGLMGHGGLDEDGQEGFVSAAEWEDSCFDILVGMLDHYRQFLPRLDHMTSRQRELGRVIRFIDTLGGKGFLKDDGKKVDWDKLELLRWPHLHYPMPSAIKRRLRGHKRHLWIQPEGLDLATGLPTGRLRYQLLFDIVDQYSSVLTWASKIAPSLPAGWRGAVYYLVETIQNHRIKEVWQKELDTVWYSLHSLLRNAAPVIFIADQMLRGKRLSGTRKSATAFLPSINGCGAILNRLRGTRKARLAGVLAPQWKGVGQVAGLNRLAGWKTTIQSILEGAQAGGKLEEIALAYWELLSLLSNARATGDRDEDDHSVAEAMGAFFADDQLNVTESKEWYIGDLVDGSVSKIVDEVILPSLLGTKVDYLWQSMSLILQLERATRRFRYYDGYHFLACVLDLRNAYKGAIPPMPLSLLEKVLDLFLSGLEGIIAQLAFCVEQSGELDLVERIAPEGVKIMLPPLFSPPSAEELAVVLAVRKTDADWYTYVLGIPGKDSVGKLCYQDGQEMRRLKE